jgi:glycosyltransferase involved in cell wall biosynthesis
VHKLPEQTPSTGSLTRRWPWRKAPQSSLPDSLANGRPWPKFSIVIPTYNQGDYIEETLLSVIQQRYPYTELIVIDGGSTDHTIQVVDRYKGHITHFVSEKDRGQSHAINKGMKIASGDIVTWLNSDDMLAEGALEAMAVAFAVSGADVVAGVCRIHSNYEFQCDHLTACADGILPLSDLLDLDGGWNAGKFFYQPEVFFSRAIWLRAGGHVREDLYYSMDYELWLRMAANHARLHVIGRPIALFRRHALQKTAAEQAFKSELIEVRNAYVAETGAEVAANPFGNSGRKLTFCFLNDIGWAYGAGIAHRRLAQAISAAGHRVRVIRISDPQKSSAPLISSDDIAAQVAQTNCDIVLLGNLHASQLEPSTFMEIFQRWPTLVVLHDFWWLTGRCAYTAGCRKFEFGCDGTCPTPTEYPQLKPDKIADAWQQKRGLLGNTNAVLLANSAWTKAFAQTSGAVPPAAMEQIRIGIEPAFFTHRDKPTARALLDLPVDRTIVMMSTSSLTDPRKGVGSFLKFLESNNVEDICVLVLGNCSEEERAALPEFCVLPGYISDAKELALYFAAADVFVGANVEETFGQVFAEAAALGVPTIAHGRTGITSVVADGFTGFLTKSCSNEELLRLVLMIQQKPETLRRVSRLAPIYMSNEYSIEASYHSIFQALSHSGLLDRFGVRANITFTPFETRRDVSIQFDSTHWVGGSGVCEPEGPYAEYNILTRMNWLQGPVSEIIVNSDKSETLRILIEYQNNLFDEQRVLIEMNGAPLGKKRLARTRQSLTRGFSFKADVRPGENTIILNFAKWIQPKGDKRNLALIMNGLTILPSA